MGPTIAHEFRILIRSTQGKHPLIYLRPLSDVHGLGQAARKHRSEYQAVTIFIFRQWSIFFLFAAQGCMVDLVRFAGVEKDETASSATNPFGSETG
jgi:hypothetical protein